MGDLKRVIVYIASIRRLLAKKSVIVAFPPERYSYELKNVATGVYHIGEEKLKQNILPDKIKTKSGYIIQRPDKWK